MHCINNESSTRDGQQNNKYPNVICRANLAIESAKGCYQEKTKRTKFKDLSSIEVPESPGSHFPQKLE